MDLTGTTSAPRNLLGRFLALLMAGMLLLIAGAVAPAYAQPEDIKPPTTVSGSRSGDIHEGGGGATIPNCGSKNVDGTKGSAYWEVTSSLGNGSVIYPGREWTVTAEIKAETNGSGDNGPNPLILGLLPSGPVQAVGLPTGDLDAKSPGNMGDSWVGEVGPVGPFHYQFDANSDPGVFTASDWVHVQMTVKYRAVAPGYISLGGLTVSGYDGTPSDEGNFDCVMSTLTGQIKNGLHEFWNWTVVNPEKPTSGPDLATTDATYDMETLEDANGGAHGISIDVLANDADPNSGGAQGDTDEVRIKDWQPKSVKGGTVSCGTAEQKGAGSFAQMSTGPCSYRPAPGATGADQFGYMIRSVSGQERYTHVNVSLAPNRAPFASDSVFGAMVNTPATFKLSPVDPDGDPVSCIADPQSVDGGDVFINTDCTADWTPDPGFTGTADFSYIACDTHATLADGAIGVHAEKAPGYSEGAPDDLSASTSRRCAQLPAHVNVSAGLNLPPVGVGDFGIVDAGYAPDGVGPYSIELPVLDNDYDNNGPDPADPGSGVVVEVLDGPDPAQGSATVLPNRHIRFTPASGVEGFVSFTYRLCEDPLQQLPPYVDNPDTPFFNEGLPRCGVGKVLTFVYANQAPVAMDDEVLTVTDNPIVDLDVAANDTDPEGTPLSCVAGPINTKTPELIAAASIDAACLLDVTPAPGASGVAFAGYSVCDSHTLSKAIYGADPYGADGRNPGDVAPRCSEGTVKITVFAPLVADPVDHDPLPVCPPDEAVTPAGVALDIPVLANDTDLDINNAPSPLSVIGASSGDNEDVSEKGGVALPTGDASAVSYTPPAGFSGIDTFTYTAQDSAGHGCKADVKVTVLGNDDVPNGDGLPSGDVPSGDVPTGDTPTGGDTEIRGFEIAGDGPAGRGSELPRTGATVLSQLGAALSLVGAGGALTALSRRRRV